MGNAWVSPLISQTTGKYKKTHRMRRTWEICTHTFPIVWVLFSIRFLSYDILQRRENAWVFSSNFSQHQKSQQNSSNGKGLGNWFPYFFHKVCSFVKNWFRNYVFTNHDGISAESITIAKSSLISELLDMTVHRQVNVHHKHISVGSIFFGKLCETLFEINKLNPSCIGQCKFL